MSSGGRGLKRAANPMLDDVRAAIEREGLKDAYHLRPTYQQKDYLGRIARAKLERTRLKHLAKMPYQLRRGGVYTNMPPNPRSTS